jgi:hypothetical protein
MQCPDVKNFVAEGSIEECVRAVASLQKLGMLKK